MTEPRLAPYIRANFRHLTDEGALIEATFEEERLVIQIQEPQELGEPPPEKAGCLLTIEDARTLACWIGFIIEQGALNPRLLSDEAVASKRSASP